MYKLENPVESEHDVTKEHLILQPDCRKLEARTVYK